MKKMCVLLVMLSLLIAPAIVVAQTTTTPTPNVISSLISKTDIEVTVFDAFGVAISSTRTITTKTKTVRQETGKADITSESTTTQVINSSWRGGGLKIDTLNGTTTTTGSDGSSATSTFWADYTQAYDASGKLAYADKIVGGSHSEELDGKGGKIISDTTNSYIIRNGEALESGSVTISKSYGPDGVQTSQTTSTTSNSYLLMGGSWVMTSSTTHNVTTGMGSQAGTSSDTNRTITYNRDANGVLKGMSVLMTGTRVISNGNGGFVTQTITSAVFDITYDAQMGYYISKQTITWETVNPTPPARVDPAITGKIQLIGGDLYMFVDSITDNESTKAGNGGVVKIVAAQGQEAELEALKDLIASKGGLASGFTLWGLYEGEGADSYTSQVFVFQGVGYGPFLPKNL